MGFPWICSRSVRHSAHPRLAFAVGEQITDSEQRIVRPRQIYLGSGVRDYVPMALRPMRAPQAPQPQSV